MTFGEKIILIRKQLNWSQADLAKKIGTSAPIVGRYEREEIKPSIDVASKIADALDVTLDYLVDEDALPTFDKVTVGRLKSIQSLDEVNKSHVFAMLDAFILKCSIQNKLAAPK